MSMREDYLLRHIRQFIQALTSIRGLAAIRQEHAALDAINEAAGQLLGLRSSRGPLLSVRERVSQLTVGELAELGHETRAALASLLKEAAAIHIRQDRETEGYRCYVQALHLMLDMAEHDGAAVLPDWAPRIEDLVAALAPFSLPPSLNAMLLEYYERTGAYGKAEDILFAMRAQAPEDDSVRTSGRAFYRRLQHRTDDDLMAGNLPRDEVDTGLAGLDDE